MGCLRCPEAPTKQRWFKMVQDNLCFVGILFAPKFKLSLAVFYLIVLLYKMHDYSFSTVITIEHAQWSYPQQKRTRTRIATATTTTTTRTTTATVNGSTRVSHEAGRQTKTAYAHHIHDN